MVFIKNELEPILQFDMDRKTPFDRRLEIAKGSLQPYLAVQFMNKGKPMPLTGATGIAFKMRTLDGITTKITAGVMTTDDGELAKGITKYNWVAADVDTTGIFLGEITVTIASGQYVFPNNKGQKLLIFINDNI